AKSLPRGEFAEVLAVRLAPGQSKYLLLVQLDEFVAVEIDDRLAIVSVAVVALGFIEQGSLRTTHRNGQLLDAVNLSVGVIGERSVSADSPLASVNVPCSAAAHAATLPVAINRPSTQSRRRRRAAVIPVRAPVGPPRPASSVPLPTLRGGSANRDSRGTARW